MLHFAGLILMSSWGGGGCQKNNKTLPVYFSEWLERSVRIHCSSFSNVVERKSIFKNTKMKKRTLKIIIKKEI